MFGIYWPQYQVAQYQRYLCDHEDSHDGSEDDVGADVGVGGGHHGAEEVDGQPRPGLVVELKANSPGYFSLAVSLILWRAKQLVTSSYDEPPRTITVHPPLHCTPEGRGLANN